MDKMDYPHGLIRFTTQNALKQGSGAGREFILGRVLRPRVLVYGSVLLALTAAMMFSLAMRTPLKVDVVRDRAALSRIVAGGRLENVYRLQVMNATEQPQKYRIAAEGLEGLSVASETEFEVGPAESRWVPVRLQIPYGSAPAGSHAIHFDIHSVGGDAHVREKSVFLVPR
jgi:polyferredoxin